MRKSNKSIMAFALAATLVASTLAPATTAAAASKQNVVTKATYNSGTTTKYSYNKKGLVSKAVSTYSYKTNPSKEYDDDIDEWVYANPKDVSTTTTTTYKYNKKNKIATKTEKTVVKETTYEVDKTTGLKLGAKKGTETTTTTSVTKFTYNKKGLATQSVTTTTTGKTGDKKEAAKKRDLKGDELADGTFIAGYNKYNADGTRNYENTKANAYFYTGAVSTDEIEVTTTTKYTDNGNGSYKTTTVTTTPSVYTPKKTEDTATYYHRNIAEDGTVTMVPLTKVEGSDYKYADAEGNTYYYYGSDNVDQVIAIKTGVTVSVDTEATGSSKTQTVTKDETTEGKTVATTKYSYDKKKRVKKAVTTTVETDKTLTTTTSAYAYSSKTYSENETTVNDKETTKEKTSVSTTTYTYDKKGRAKKVVTSNDGKADAVETSASKQTSYNKDVTTTASDGTVTTTKESRSQSAYGAVIKTVTKNGVTTYSTIHNPYTDTTSNTDSEGKTSSTTNEYSFSANGCYKTVKTNVEKNGDKSIETRYYPEQYAKAPAVGHSEAWSYTHSSGSSENTNYSYSDGKNYAKTTDEAKSKFEAVAAAFVPATYEEVTSQEAALAEPSKFTTSYAYDKNGNVKSAKTSGTETSIETVKNETYGNLIYEFDAYGKLHEKQVAVTHKSTNKDAMENVVKKGTKTLTKQITASSGTSDRSKDNYVGLSRMLFSVKSKKSSSNTKKQQWIIQNGALNGEVGLN